MFRLHPQHHLAGYVRHVWDYYAMPWLLDDVIAAIFAGHGALVAESDDARIIARGYLCVELDGFMVELRGHLLDGMWRETVDVSATPIDSPT